MQRGAYGGACMYDGHDEYGLSDQNRLTRSPLSPVTENRIQGVYSASTTTVSRPYNSA